MMPNNIRFMLFPMEGNLLKIHRQNEKRNGRRVIEGIHICLLTVARLRIRLLGLSWKEIRLPPL